MKEPSGDRLNFIDTRHGGREEAMRAATHSRWVRRARWGLPLAAVAVLVCLFLWPIITMKAIKTAAINSMPDLVLEHVHYRGLDEKSQPYEVKADRATRPSGEKNIVILQKPEGKISLSDQSQVNGASQIGRYDEMAKRLWLDGQVKLSDDKGYIMQSEEAVVDMTKNTAWGSKDVTIQGDFGIINGVGFQYFGNEAIIVVRGPAKATLNLHQDNGSAKPK